MENALLSSPLSSNNNNNGKTGKSWLSKPDGKFGLVFGIGLLGIVGYFVLPILSTIIWNTLNFGLGLVCLSVFLYLVTNKQLRMSVFYLYGILMKKLVGVIIQLDPFIIAEDYINDMKKEREHLNSKLIEVNKQKESLSQTISEKLKAIEKNMQRAKVAQEKNIPQQVTLATRDAERAEDYVQGLKPILKGLTDVSDYLKKVYDNSEYTILDAESELSSQKEKYKALTSGNNALNSALKIFNGNPDKKILLDQSAEFLKDDMANKFALMKRSIDITSTFMATIDLDNAVYEERGLKKLSEMNPDLIFNSVNNPNNNIKVLSSNNETPVSNQYKGILD